MVREGRVIISGPGTRPAFGVGYYVQALEVGAQVTEASSGVTATVAAGHGLAADDKVIVNLDIQQYRIVESVTATEITFTESVSLAAGDFLVNLAEDTGSIQPNYDGAGLQVFTDMDYQNVAITNTVLTDSDGRYRYFHQGVPRWELVRDSNGSPFTIYMDDSRQDDTVFAHHFADSGDGTEDSPWSLTGSNPVQAALDSLPDSGGTVRMIAGHYDLGSSDPAVSIPVLVDGDDHRAYTLIGAGRDLTFLHYSGTGAAVAYDQINSGSPGDSYQSNQLRIGGFTAQQRGTARTGVGFRATYISESIFEDIGVGNLRQDRDGSGPDYAFEYGIKIATDDPVGDGEVSDFNRFHRIYSLGNTHGMYVQNQGDNTVVSECSFEPRQDVAEAQDGLEINNSGGTLVTGCHFNFFNFNSSCFGLKLSTACNGAAIVGNYFESNKTSVYLNTTGHQGGITVSGNQFSFNDVTSGVGVRCGIDGAYTLTGAHVHGNSFFVLSATNLAVRIGSDCDGFVVGPNRYDDTGGDTVTYQTGCRGISTDTDLNGFPVIQLIDTEEDSGRIILRNTNVSAQRSPFIQFEPGGGGSLGRIGVSAAGKFQWHDASGVFQFEIDQTGNASSVGNLTSGGHLRGVKTAVSVTGNDAITTAGRFLIDLTNTSGTNTITLAAPSSVDGKILILRVAALTSGTLSLADSGNVNLSAAWTTPGVDDTLTLVASGVIWYEIARSNN